MITEDYVSFETAKLLKEKGFKIPYDSFRGVYINGIFKRLNPGGPYGYNLGDEIVDVCSLQMAMKWLRETHSILLIVDYDYECTATSYCYKIYRLGEHGKPERVAVYGVSYDKNDNPTEHIVGYRDYERSYSDYGAYEEACEAAIKYCLENLI